MNSIVPPRLACFFRRITRLIAVTGALAVAIAMASVLTAWSQIRGTEQLVTDPEQVKMILTALDDAVWFADGSAGDKHVYVIYSTACGISKKFFTDTRALLNRPQLRWLTLDDEGHGAGMVVTRRTVESLRAAFAGKYDAQTDATTASHAMSINQALRLVLPNAVYPTLIYKTTKGLRITYGAPPNLGMFTSAVQSRPDRATYQPASLGWLSKPAVIKTSNHMREYRNSAAAIPMRIAPYPDAPVLRELANGGGVYVDAVANDEWIRVSLGKTAERTLYGYIHAPLQIKLANLEFTVRPMSGVVSTDVDTLEIRSHPTMDAPVIDRRGPGLHINKTGEVIFDGRNWVEVRVYTDGTKGYIIQSPLQIKLANLEFTVRPAGGGVNTGRDTLEIRSHPTMDAPVIDRPGPGLLINKTGEVVLEGRNWTEVIVYDDGTKGYIAQ